MNFNKSIYVLIFLLLFLFSNRIIAQQKINHCSAGTFFSDASRPTSILYSNKKMHEWHQRPLKRASELFGFHYNGLLGGEIGISHTVVDGDMSVDFNVIPYRSSYTLSLSSEFYYKNNFIVAPKFGAWYNSAKFKMFSFGANALFLFQTSSQNMELIFRPEAGIILPRLDKERENSFDDVYSTFGEIKLVYGYNFGYNLSGEKNLLQANQVSLIIYLSTDQKKYRLHVG